MMKAARVAFFALVCFLPLAASAQWTWLDKGGRKVFSDQPPPADVAPERILKQPGQRSGSAPAPVATSTAAAAPATTAANLPKPTGKDKALDEKMKQMEAADAEKKKAEEAKVAALRAENCNRARASKANYESGMRMSRLDAKGEREYLDDNQRAAEIKVLNDVIARDCRQ